MLDHALNYIARGWAVLPLHTTEGPRCSCHQGADCKSPGKHPRTSAGVSEATTDEATVREWWARWPDAWVGIATGEASGVWVLDVDRKAPTGGTSGELAWEDLQDQHGPVDALRAQTGSGGEHVFFLMPRDGREVRNRQRLPHAGMPSGVDVRGTGGYIVAPPSGHHTGGRYQWVEGPLNEAPGWLLELVAPVASRPAVASNLSLPVMSGIPAEGETSRERRYAQRALEGALQDILQAPEGGRHDLLNRKAYTIGGYAQLLGGVDACVQPFVDAFVAATGDPKREAEARRTAFDGLSAGAQRPRQVPESTRDNDRPVDPSWMGPVDLPEEDEDIPVDSSWWQEASGAGVDASLAGGGDTGKVGGPSPADTVSGVSGATSRTQPTQHGQPASIEQPTGTTVPDRPQQRRASGFEGRLTIRVNQRQMYDVLADAWDAVGALPPGRALYQQDGRLVRVMQTEVGPRVEEVTGGWLTSTLVAAARWVKLRKATAKDVVAAGESWVETDTDRLPSYVVSSMVGAPRVNLPILERIERAPYIAPDGEVVAVEGYRRDTRTYLGPCAPPVQMGFEEATALLREWLSGFPFVGSHDWAHTLGFLVTPIVRSMVSGPCPVHVFEAPERGTGKTLLMEVVSRVAAGYQVSASKLASNDEERRKSLVAHLLAGSSVVLLDNITGRVDDDTLAGILTSYPRYADRRMGGQSLTWAPARAVWAMSGNNMTMSPDIARRAVVIRLDAQMERPSERTGFAIRDLRAWTEKNAHRLRSAVLAIVRHWVDLGQPAGAGRLGSYEAWSRVVGGIVSEVTDGWLGGREERLRRADPEREDWRRLIRCWLAGDGQNPMQPRRDALRASEVWQMAVDNDLLMDVRGDGTKSSQIKRLGYALRAMRGVVMDIDGVQRQIVESPRTRGGQHWRVSGDQAEGAVVDIGRGGR